MAFGFTRTLPTITGSYNDFPVLLNESSFPVASIDGGGSSINNGGGNLRAYTDSTKSTAIPLDIVTFVTGGTPDVEVWVEIPTAATGNTIYFEADEVETTQPSVTDPIGRNAVWSSFVAAFVGTDGTDHAGNFDLTESGTGSTSATVTDSGISGISFDGSVSLKNSSWIKLSYPICALFWGRRDPSSSTQCIYSQGNDLGS